MLYIVGSRTSLVKSEVISDKCPNCSHTNCLQINIYQKYMMAFWIPIIPDGKTGAAICSNCNQTFSPFQLPSYILPSYENIKSKTKTPIWTFSGLFIVFLAIVGVFIYNHQNDKKISQYILAPQINDVYEIHMQSGDYTLYKIKKIEGDTISFFANKYQTNDVTGLSDLADKGYKESETVSRSKTNLLDMAKKDIIIDIDRK